MKDTRSEFNYLSQTRFSSRKVFTMTLESNEVKSPFQVPSWRVLNWGPKSVYHSFCIADMPIKVFFAVKCVSLRTWTDICFVSNIAQESKAVFSSKYVFLNSAVSYSSNVDYFNLFKIYSFKRQQLIIYATCKKVPNS